jgi:hypothetical protein
MRLVIDEQATVRCLYDEAFDLSPLGEVSIRRASHVEPDAAGRWWADLSPSGGPKFGPFVRRSVAIAAEMAWIEAHGLSTSPPSLS